MNTPDFMAGCAVGTALTGGTAILAWCLIAKVEQRSKDSFANLSSTALRQASQDFLQLAETTLSKTSVELTGSLEQRQQSIHGLLQPIETALLKITEQSEQMERRRVSAYDGLSVQIQTLASEADQLATALRRPAIRGNWGEMMLRTVCENAGLVEEENFLIQDYSEGDTGILKPDMVLKLPKKRVLIIDSKVPMDAFREALEATDQITRSAKMQQHAKHVRGHLKKLSAKSYWSRYSDSPDCTVLFIPSESAYYSALEADPELITEAANARILIANPMTLVGLVRAVAHILDEERLKESADEVREVGRKLYDGIRTCLTSLGKLGRNLRLSADSFNEVVKTIDGAVVPKARRLRELGSATGDEIAIPVLCEVQLCDVTVMVETDNQLEDAG